MAMQALPASIPEQDEEQRSLFARWFGFGMPVLQRVRPGEYLMTIVVMIMMMMVIIFITGTQMRGR
jgi:hypothetical protein